MPTPASLFRLSSFSILLHCCCLSFFLLGAGALPAQEVQYTFADTVLARRLVDEAKALIDSAQYDKALEKLDTAGRIYEQVVGEEGREYGPVLILKGNCFYRQGEYDKATEYYQRALEVSLKTLGPDDPQVASAYSGQAAVFLSKGNYGRAAEFFEKALELRLKILGPEHQQVGSSYYNLGIAYWLQGKYELAAEFQQKALEIRIKRLGPDHSDVAASYNNLGKIFYSKGDYDKAAEFNQMALEIWSITLSPEHSRIANSYNVQGAIYYAKGDYDQAIGFYRKALGIQLKSLGPEHPQTATSYNNLGLAHYQKSDYSDAEELFQKALKIKIKTIGQEHPDIAGTYSNLGALFFSRGDYGKAAEYVQKALKIKIKTIGPEHPSLTEDYNILGVIHHSKGDYGRAAEYYQKGLEIGLRTLGDENQSLANLYNNLGATYKAAGDLEKATELYEKGLAIRSKTFGDESLGVAGLYNNLGEIYKLKGDYGKAIELYQKGLEIRLKTLGQNHPNVASSYNNMGDIYTIEGDYNRAAELYQKALDIWLESYGDKHPDLAAAWINLMEGYKEQRKFSIGEPFIQQTLRTLNYTGLSSLPQTNSIQRLIIALTAKGAFYQAWHTHSQNPHHLHTARQAFAEALAAINYQRRQLESPSSRSTLAQKSTPVYEGGISTNLSLHRLTDSLHYFRDAFNYSEQYKALSLYEAVKNAEALHVAGIPDSLLLQEYDQRVDIAFYEKKRQDLFAEGKQETDSTVLVVSGQLFELNRAHEALIRQFENEYPDYYRLKYGFSTAGIEEVQHELLQPNQTLLEYFTGDSSIFIFAIRQDTALAVEIKKDFPLEAWVDSLRLSLVDNYTTGAADYCRLAWRLYEKLVLPVEGMLSEELTVIPDGRLNYLPFEALLSAPAGNPVHFRDHPYLLRRCHISYCYSATLLREMRDKQHRRPAEKPLLAFAPYYDGDTTLLASLFAYTGDHVRKKLDPLPHSGEEAFGIAKITSGEALYGEAATLERFTREAPGYRVLHLATHGQSGGQSGDYSFLAFTEIKDSLDNELLYVRDLYNIELNAELVVLSACETAIGPLQRGEGVISLARAFAYAGAKSMATSLWTVADEATKELMLRFYRHLKEGLPKDEALRRAKLEYQDNSSQAQAHPFFWAGFVLVGDQKAVAFE